MQELFLLENAEASAKMKVLREASDAEDDPKRMRSLLESIGVLPPSSNATPCEMAILAGENIRQLLKGNGNAQAVLPAERQKLIQEKLKHQQNRQIKVTLSSEEIFSLSQVPGAHELDVSGLLVLRYLLSCIGEYQSSKNICTGAPCHEISKDKAIGTLRRFLHPLTDADLFLEEKEQGNKRKLWRLIRKQQSGPHHTPELVMSDPVEDAPEHEPS